MNLSVFQQSVFLQSLGWAIANSIWQGGVIWVIYNIFVSSNSHAPAKLKNTASTISLFAVFLWFTATFATRFIYLQNNVTGLAHRPFSFAFRLYPSHNGPDMPGFISYFAFTLPYLSVAYLFLLLIFAIKLTNSYRNTNIIKSKGLVKPGVDWRLFVSQAVMHIGIHKKVKLWFSNHVDVPATIGFFKPVILIPVASLAQLTASQLEAIILHELSHIRRNDYLINIFISLVETVLFFNPFIALLSRIIKKERENCCDDFVLQYQYDRYSYASALLCLEKHRNRNFRLALNATSGKKLLLLRIKRIIEVKNNANTMNYGQKLMALIVTTAIICSIAWLSPDKKVQQHFVQKQTPVKTSQSGFTQSREKEPTASAAINTRKGHIANNPATAAGKERQVNEASQAWGAGNRETNPLMATVAGNDDILEGANGADMAVPEGFWAHPPPMNVESDFDLAPPAGFSDSSLALTFSFDIDTQKLMAGIEKNNKAIALINWNRLGKELLENFEKLKIEGVKMNFPNYEAPAVAYKYNLLREKDQENAVQIQLLNKISAIAKRNIDCAERQKAINQKTIDILINTIIAHRNSYGRAPENKRQPLPPRPKKTNNAVTGESSQYIFSEDRDLNAEDAESPSDGKPLPDWSVKAGDRNNWVVIEQKEDRQGLERLTVRRIISGKLQVGLNREINFTYQQD